MNGRAIFGEPFAYLAGWVKLAGATALPASDRKTVSGLSLRPLIPATTQTAFVRAPARMVWLTETFISAP